MAIITIDDHRLEIDDNERLNGIEAAARVGIEIPRYCWHPGLPVAGSCRMCLVEYGTRDAKTGQINMLPKLVPACQMPAVDGTVFVTNTPKVAQARAMVEEALLLRHPIDCPICDKAGECYLQDHHFDYGQPERRADVRPKTSRRRDLGTHITLFVDRCVMCSRCVRFTREVSGTSELMVTGRGASSEIDVVEGFPLENRLSGNVVDLCPVGALGDKEFLYKQRVWFLRSHEGICTGCSTGCSIWIDENQQRVWRLRPRENRAVNRWWMCDEGRYGWAYLHDPNRLTVARRRENGSATPVDNHGLAVELNQRLRHLGGPIAAVLSPFLTVEEAYLLATYVRGIDPEATLVLGPVPTASQDETFRGGFTIRAEKCPNRRGVEQVIAGLAGRVTTFAQLLGLLDARAFRAVWFSGGYRKPWIDEATAARFAKVQTLVVQDLFPSPLSNLAAFELPGAASAERAGSYVNATDRLQTCDWAVRPPRGVLGEGTLLWQLSGLEGLYQPSAVIDDVARRIPYFAPAADSVASGVDLRPGRLAESIPIDKNSVIQ
ncbi:MAG TPA: 2Fe-2S iron-sulfur cluster-binding protein [Thermoguttaceae bacterium]|nr:2Fe-2S iron-sulfur cluster-binding protein [Thermoguttaceae bacterium]